MAHNFCYRTTELFKVTLCVMHGLLLLLLLMLLAMASKSN
jgi:hypothetical protein